MVAYSSQEDKVKNLAFVCSKQSGPSVQRKFVSKEYEFFGKYFLFDHRPVRIPELKAR